MAQLFANNATTTLSSPLTNSATSMVVVDASSFPTLGTGDWYYLTLTTGNPESAWEIVKVTAASTNTLTIVRGQDGTSGVAWSAGAKVQLRATAGTLASLVPGKQAFSGAIAFLKRDIGGISSSTSTVTGTLKITLPVAMNNTMMRLRIVGYNYQTLGAWDVVTSGYNSSTSGWVHTSALVTGLSPFTSIRFGFDGTYACILLGVTTTSWSYPKIIVEELGIGHTGATASGWDSPVVFAFITDETGITITETPVILEYADDTAVVHLTGNESVQGIKVFQAGRTEFADNATDAAVKNARLTVTAYTNAQIPVTLAYAYAASTSNIVAIGGGTSAGQATMVGRLYAAAAVNTATGTIIASWDITGFQVSYGGFTVSVSGSTPLVLERTGTGQTNCNMKFSINPSGTPIARYFGIDDAGNLLFGTAASLATTGYTLWHSGNDGAGSGLVADSAATFTTARTINGVSFNGSANITVYALPAANLPAAYLSATFAHGVANQKVDIILGAGYFDGEFEVSISSTYSNQNAAGKLTKVFAFGATAGNSTPWQNSSRYSEVHGPIADNFAISDITWDATNSTYRIQIVHRVSTGNPVFIEVKGLTTVPGNITGATIGSVYTTDTTVFAKPYISFTNNVTWPSHDLDPHIIKKSIIKTGLSNGVALDLFTITTTNESGSNDGGAYSCKIKALVTHGSTTTSGASASIYGEWVFLRSMIGAGTGTNGAADTIKLTSVVATNAASRTITGNAVWIVETTEYVQTIQFQPSFSGSGATTGTATIEIELMYDGFTTAPTINLV